MYESLSLQFFRTTTGIQSGEDTSDESRFVKTFLSILGIMEILCNFRLVLDRKTGKEIPGSSRLEFLEKFLANIFVLSDTEDIAEYCRFTFAENTISNLQKVLRAKFLGKDGLFCFSTICKFGTAKPQEEAPDDILVKYVKTQ